MLPHFVTLLSQREITSPSVFIICYADLLKKKQTCILSPHHLFPFGHYLRWVITLCVVTASFLRGKV